MQKQQRVLDKTENDQQQEPKLKQESSMGRPRKSPFDKLLDRMETFRRGGTTVRVRKYNEARTALIAYVREIERAHHAQAAMLEAIREAISEPDAIRRIDLFLRMSERPAHSIPPETPR